MLYHPVTNFLQCIIIIIIIIIIHACAKITKIVQSVRADKVIAMKGVQFFLAHP